MAGPMRKPLLRNAGFKILSLLLAVLLWYLAAGQEKMETGLIIPVEFTNVPENVALEGNSLEFVHVRLRGSRSDVQNISPQQVSAKLDLKGFRPGNHIITIDNRNIHLPRGVELVSIIPQYLSAQISARQLVPIRANIRGRPAEGYQVAKVSVMPAKIYVIGPPHKVSLVREVNTLPVSIKGATGPVTVRAEILPPDPEVRLMEIKPTEVSVIVEGHHAQKVFGNVPVEAPAGEVAAVAPGSVEVTVSGPFDRLEALAPGSIKASIDAGDSPNKVENRKVLLRLPAGLTLVKVTPATVKVTKR